jgi:licD1 protein
MNRKLTLTEIQKVSLEVLCKVDSFCREHGIRYSLTYGTLLGAVRHKGFIPWDDDIDIMMPRPDYERLLSTFKGDNEVRLISEYQSYITFSRVCDIKSTFCETLLPYAPQKLTSKTGVWIDIFPVDGVESDIKTFKEKVDFINHYCSLQLQRRWGCPSLTLRKGYMYLLKLLYRKIKYIASPVYKINNAIRNCRKPYTFENADYVSQIVCGKIYDREIFKKEIFDEYIEVTFEGHNFKAVSCWDEVLRATYGDYMELPSKENRIQHSVNHTFFYWK